MLGELHASEREYDELRAALRRMIPLRQNIRDLKRLVEASEMLLLHIHPNWDGRQIKPSRARTWKSPFKPGDQGQFALSILREAQDWLRPREVAELMLRRIEHDPDDDDTLHRLANSVGNYFKKYEGELVESRGSFAKEWRVIQL
ncbi:hypothetical protein [Croceicoccus bisphenolivorans]|uniref:hypothetical protein n=1 Tax=Croceicoccus bisphenolivorans TaxID=1783232 RepID=UPI000B19299B|nr:hypothetical protein [Croceicoccus bisphenolivorans]